MEQLQNSLMNAKEIVAFAVSKGWSEEELAKVINILHSELEDVYLSAPQFETAL